METECILPDAGDLLLKRRFEFILRDGICMGTA